MAAGGRGEARFKAQFMSLRLDGALPQCLEGEKYFNQTPDGYKGINKNPAVFTNQGMWDIYSSKQLITWMHEHSILLDDGMPTVCGGNEDYNGVVDYPCIKYNATSDNWEIIGSPIYDG